MAYAKAKNPIAEHTVLSPQIAESNEKYWHDLREYQLLHCAPEEKEWLSTHLDQKKSVSDTVLLQYVTCTSVLQEIFKLAPDQCWLEDGVGCCGWEGSVDDDQGAALESWKTIRQALRDHAFPTRKTDFSACTYHKPGVGCVLGELKSPKCLYTICEHDGKLPRSYSDLHDKEVLTTVLAGGFSWGSDGGFSYDPDRNWPLVQEFVRKGQKVIEDILAKRLVQVTFPGTLTRAKESNGAVR